MDTEVFWAAVAAIGTVAALIATLVTIAVGAWLRNRNRPEPEWEVDIRYSSQTREWADRVGGTFFGSVTNVGDGSAFQLRLASKDGSVIPISWKTASFNRVRASMLTGDKIDFSLDVGLDDWVGEVVTLTWIEAPTRLGKMQTKTVDLTQGESQPAHEFTRDSPLYGKEGVITRQEWESDNTRRAAERAQAEKEKGGR